MAAPTAAPTSFQLCAGKYGGLAASADRLAKIRVPSGVDSWAYEGEPVDEFAQMVEDSGGLDVQDLVGRSIVIHSVDGRWGP